MSVLYRSAFQNQYASTPPKSKKKFFSCLVFLDISSTIAQTFREYQVCFDLLNHCFYYVIYYILKLSFHPYRECPFLDTPELTILDTPQQMIFSADMFEHFSSKCEGVLYIDLICYIQPA